MEKMNIVIVDKDFDTPDDLLLWGHFGVWFFLSINIKYHINIYITG